MLLTTASVLPSGEYAISCILPLPSRAIAPLGKLNCVESWAIVESLNKSGVVKEKKVNRKTDMVFIKTPCIVEVSVTDPRSTSLSRVSGWL